MGESFVNYISSRRIQLAKELLQETGKSITQIADEVGYDNISHFTAVFKRTEGITPSAYRASKKTKKIFIMRALLSEKCTKPGLRHKILCRSPFVQFSQLQKPKFVKVLLYTNEKDKITTKGKKVQQKPCKGRKLIYCILCASLIDCY